MDYTGYLKEMLLPLGLYALEEGIGAQELAVIGGQMDLLFEALEELGREVVPASAEDYGLELFEEILPYKPASPTLEDQRRAILSLLRIRGGSFTLSRLRETLSGCGLAAEIAETEDPLAVSVCFPRNRGIPPNFGAVRKRIETIVPCHLQIEYIFIYTIWQELMIKLFDWRQLEERARSWRELEIFE